MDPTEAVCIHEDIQSRHSLGIHWGTFPTGYEVLQMVCRNDTFSSCYSYESALDMHDMEDSSQGSELHGIMESCKTLDQKLFLKRALFILILSTKALHYITLN